MAQSPGPAAVGTGSRTALLTDRYELTMLEAALRSGLAERRAVFEVFTRRLPPGRRFGVVAGQGRLAGAAAGGLLRRAGAVRAATSSAAQARDWLRDRTLGVEVSGYAEGEVFVPGSPVVTVSGLLRRGPAARDARAVGAQPRQRRRVRSGSHGAGGRRPAAARDGRSPHARAGGGRGGPGGVRRRLRDDQQPGGRSAPRRAHRGHERARLHPCPPQRAGRVPVAGGHPRRRHDAAGRHLRHRAGDPQRGRGRRHRTRRRAPGQRRSRRSRCPVRGRCSTSSARPRPASSSPATSTSTRSRRWRRPPSTRSASGRRSSPVPALPPRASSTSSSPSRRTTIPTRPASRSPSSRPARRRSAGASGRTAPTTGARSCATSRAGTAARCRSRCRRTDLDRARATCAAALAALPDEARRLDPGAPAWTAEKELP